MVALRKIHKLNYSYKYLSSIAFKRQNIFYKQISLNVTRVICLSESHKHKELMLYTLAIINKAQSSTE